MEKGGGVRDVLLEQVTLLSPGFRVQGLGLRAWKHTAHVDKPPAPLTSDMARSYGEIPRDPKPKTPLKPKP